MNNDHEEETAQAQEVAPLDAKGRACHALVILAIAMVFLVGSRLEPNPAGRETHVQLGLPRCAFLSITGMPCPTCGVTTAITHLAHGDIETSVRTQPFGTMLGLLSIALTLPVGYDVWTGRARTLAWFNRARLRHVLIVIALAASSWLYVLMEPVLFGV